MLIEEAEESGQESMTADLQKIRRAGKNLLALVDAVLDLSRADAGELALALEEFSVAELIQTLAEEMEPMARKKGNVLRISCPEDIGAMHADLPKVKQCLQNLLSNAHKFTDGREIRLSVQREPHSGEERLSFVVEDEGIGISAEEIGKIFDPFTQVDAGATRKQDGSGLGLAITLRYCQMMGGEVEVESEPGKGSVFTLRLPVRCDSMPS
jgi:signal transduction histidine kinase